MSVKSFEDWSDGLDVRRPKNLDNQKSLIELHNAYVTNGGAIRRRPGAKYLLTQNSNDGGLTAHNGKLITFNPSIASLNTIADGHNTEVWGLRSSPPSGASKPVHCDYAAGFNTGFYFVLTWDNNKTCHYWVSDFTTRPGSSIGIVSGAPTTKGCVVWNQRVYAISNDGTKVQYSNLSKPDDWTGGDAGFIPTGEMALNDNIAKALTVISNRLVVFMADCIQIWALDPDPKKVELEEQVGGIGTRWPGSVKTINKDVFFLSDLGIRSLGSQTMMQNIKGSDIGSAIDALVAPHIRNEMADIDSQFYPGEGQYWLLIRDKANVSSGAHTIFVLSKSKADKLNAWSTYSFGSAGNYNMMQFAHLGEKLYGLNADPTPLLYVMDHDCDTDGQSKSPFPVKIQSPFYAFGQEGQYKMFTAMEAIFEGVVTMEHCVNPNDISDKTHAFEVAGDTRTVPSIPLGILAPTMSTRITAKSKYADYADGIPKPGFKSLNSLIYRFTPTRGGI